MKLKKMGAGIAVAVLAMLGVGITGTAASAHTSKVNGSAVCEADGTYTVTWTYDATNVPNGVEAETKAMTTSAGKLAPIDGVDKGGQIFLSVWTQHQINVPGAPVKTGNWSAKFKTVSIPGTAKEVTTMVQTDWLNGPSEDPVGKVVLAGDCKVPAPVIKEIPYPTMLADDVCGAQNDPVYVDPAWVAQYGSLVNGPWIDTKYKQQNGKWVVDGSAQIKPELRGQYIWAGTAGKTPSDFTRWQMYPGTSPFVHEDIATACPPLEVEAKHLASGEATCGAYSITLYNKQSEGEANQTASYVVYIDGKFNQAYSVAANEEKVITGTFAEDSGNHQVIVRSGPAQGDEFQLSLDVLSDCETTIPPTEEPPVVNPPTTEEPPVTNNPPAEKPVKPAARTVTPQTDELAQTGSAFDPLFALTGGALAIALGAAAVVLGLRHRQINK